MHSASATGGSSLRPAWHKGTGGQGGRGFQPPPTVTSDRGRSSSWGSQERGSNLNKFSALQDDDDGSIAHTGNSMSNGGGSSSSNNNNGSAGAVKSDSNSNEKSAFSNSRSEAFRTSFHRASSTGGKPPGRSLADLAARVPDTGLGPRRHTSGYEGRNSGTGSRFPVYRSSEAGSSGHAGSIETYRPDPNVIRFTREKLLSMRPAPIMDQELPAVLKGAEGSVVLSPMPQDPVCWDTFDAEEIWAMAPRERRSSTGTPKGMTIGMRGMPEAGEPRRHSVAVQNPGRWRRGIALPPEEARRNAGDAENPDELWDDPIGGATGAAADFSAFGAMPDDEPYPNPAREDLFDSDKMMETSQKLEDEMLQLNLASGANGIDIEGEDENGQPIREVKVDPKRPLASLGTKISSGSGDHVNVFEDFDAPAIPDDDDDAEKDSPSQSAADQSARSRLMKMIGVSSPEQSGGAAESTALNNPWNNTDEISNKSENSSKVGDPVFGSNIEATSSSVPLNPWGDPILSTQSTTSLNSGDIDLAARLEAFAAGHKAREDRVAVQMEQQRAQQEALRLQEENRRLALARRQAEERARQQAMQSQQQSSQQSQIELVLMERICAILENSWGRSDLMSILSTLHSEDSRVIPLLSNVDALRALMARSPQRVATRRDPNFPGGMAILLLTNAQWQMQRNDSREELQQREQSRRVERGVAVRSAAESISIIPNAPWYYSDPQQNIQGPFPGEEMRQWLEAGYFKGDLPISQQPDGQFRPLSAIFPDLEVAFKYIDTRENNTPQGKSQDIDLVQDEVNHREKLEARLNIEAAPTNDIAKDVVDTKVEPARQHIEPERNTERAHDNIRYDTEQKNITATEPDNVSTNAGNEKSTKLKLMLGMPGGNMTKKSAASMVTTDVTAGKGTVNSPVTKKKTDTSMNPQEKLNEESSNKTKHEPIVATSAKPAATAWGGATASKPRKSMSEIQREEARAAAIVASHRDTLPRQSNSGWANVAAAGTSGWSSSAVKQKSAAAAVGNPAALISGLRPGGQPLSKSQSVAANKSRKDNFAVQPKRNSTLAEEFGASMSPSMEKWCKEQMMDIKGKDDITLVAFCMTLGDASEIREYLTTYLGASPQVNSFATEFINKRGLGRPNKEEWETPGSAKKGRKKKGGR